MSRSTEILALALATLGACATTPELPPEGPERWQAMREAGHRWGGEPARAAQAWMRGEATLTLRGGAREERVDWPQEGERTWPVAVDFAVDLEPGRLRAIGHYQIFVRAEGLLWTTAASDPKDWRRADRVWTLFGDPQRPWPALPEADPFDDPVLDAYGPRSRVCADHRFDDPPPGPHHCEADGLLMPLRPSPGPDLLIVTALVQWPDDEVDATTWRPLQFALPLSGSGSGSLAERIDAALATPTTLRPAPPEIERY